MAPQFDEDVTCLVYVYPSLLVPQGHQVVEAGRDAGEAGEVLLLEPVDPPSLALGQKAARHHVRPPRQQGQCEDVQVIVCCHTGIIFARSLLLLDFLFPYFFVAYKVILQNFHFFPF